MFRKRTLMLIGLMMAGIVAGGVVDGFARGQCDDKYRERKGFYWCDGTGCVEAEFATCVYCVKTQGTVINGGCQPQPFDKLGRCNHQSPTIPTTDWFKVTCTPVCSCTGLYVVEGQNPDLIKYITNQDLTLCSVAPGGT